MKNKFKSYCRFLRVKLPRLYVHTHTHNVDKTCHSHLKKRLSHYLKKKDGGIDVMLSGGDNHHHHPEELEPSRNEPTSTPRVLTIISSVLEKLVARNDQLEKQKQPEVGNRLKAFHGIRAPSISIPKYLERIYKYTNCSPSCFVVGFVYIDRLVHKHPDSLLVSLNIHRLLVTSVMLASKMLDDVHYNNAFFARVGGVSNAELNKLELELLFLLDFGVLVSSNVFENYCQHLEKEMLRNGTITDSKWNSKSITNHSDDSAELPQHSSSPHSNS